MEENKPNTMEVPNKNAFSLVKVKLLKDGGLSAQYEVVETIGTESYTNDFKIESPKDIHPDLRECFDRLRPIMARIFNVTSFLSLLEGKDFGASKSQTEAARNFADEILKNIEIRGISYSGAGDNVGVAITGLLFVANNQKVAINSPHIKFTSITFGFEEELEEIAADIENEVYAFLFEGKKAQAELFGADGEAAQTDDDMPSDMFDEMPDNM